MSLSETVNTDIATAMKAREQVRLSALRMLKAAIMNKGVEKGRDLEDAEILQVVASLVKQRHRYECLSRSRRHHCARYSGQ